MKTELDKNIPYDNQNYLKSLNPIEMDDYLMIYKKYIKLLLEYFDELSGLLAFDNAIYKLFNNDYLIENNDYYKKVCDSKYKHVFIRNNIYVENFTEEEINYLKSVNNYDLDSEMFVEKTFDRVTIKKNNEAKNISYNTVNSEFIVPVGSVVFGISIDGFLSDKRNNNEETLKEKKIKLDSLQNIISLMEIDIGRKLGKTVKLLIYF